MFSENQNSVKYLLRHKRTAYIFSHRPTPQQQKHLYYFSNVLNKASSWHYRVRFKIRTCITYFVIRMLLPHHITIPFVLLCTGRGPN